MLDMHEMSSNAPVPEPSEDVIASQPSNKSSGLLAKLLHLNSQSGQASSNWTELMTNLEHANYDSIDGFQLEQILKFVSSEPYAKATKFLEGGNDVFCKCRLPKDDFYDGLGEQDEQFLESLSSKQKTAKHSETDQANTSTLVNFDDSVARMNVMTEEEELAALERLLRNLDNWFNYDYSQVHGDLEQMVQALKPDKKSSKLSRLTHKLRIKSSQRWARFKLRLSIYRKYFVNRLFTSTNSIITCWMFCFCASMFH